MTLIVTNHRVNFHRSNPFFRGSSFLLFPLGVLFDTVVDPLVTDYLFVRHEGALPA
jgi:hypothetical protein